MVLAVAPAARAQGAPAGSRRPPSATRSRPRRSSRAASSSSSKGRRARRATRSARARSSTPAGGTLLRLALCHEADGKLASAWLEFTEVVRLSQTGDAAKLAERVKIAKEHLASIEPRLPKLVVEVDASSQRGRARRHGERLAPHRSHVGCAPADRRGRRGYRRQRSGTSVFPRRRPRRERQAGDGGDPAPRGDPGGVSRARARGSPGPRSRFRRRGRRCVPSRSSSAPWVS